MIKTNYKDNNHNSVSFKAERPAYIKPEIEQPFLNDEGEVEYILKNGNTMLADAYKRMWEPSKGKILPKNFKGENCDGRSNWR